MELAETFGGIAHPRGKAHSRFYLFMALACAGVAFLGFAPTYFIKLATGTFRGNPILHVHASVFFAWSAFLVVQTWLAGSGQLARHRDVGLIGIVFATAMVIFGTQAAINSMKVAASLGVAERGIVFSIVPLGGIAFFAGAFALAIANVRRPETHRRLVLLAAISILDAPVARWFILFLAPPGASGPPPVAVTILPALCAYSLLVVAIVHDWRTRGGPHRVYVWGGSLLVSMKLLNPIVGETGVWRGFAGALLAAAS